MSEKLKIDGESFDTRIVNNEKIVHLYYDARFEQEFDSREDLLNALENHARSQVDDTEGKNFAFHADGK